MPNIAAITKPSALITLTQRGARKEQSPNSVATMASDLQETFRSTARAYQREMYYESLKRNIIVAMDTGSGKTLIAVDRIRYESLRKGRGTGQKIAWFMVPSVSTA